jgi:hypothetical protein
MNAFAHPSRSEQRPVGRFEPGACDLAAEHSELVTQHQNLQVLGAIASDQQGEQPDRPAQRQIGTFDSTRVTSAV